MSIAGTVRDKIITKLEALLTGRTRITKPRAIELNNDNLLKDGWGIYIGPTTIGDQSLGFHISVKATEIIIILTKRIFTLDNNFVNEAAAESDFNTDRDNIIREVAEVLRESPANGVVDLKFASDDGGEFIYGEKTHYMAFSMTFNLTYSTDKTYCN